MAVPSGQIEKRIFVIHGHRVMIDADLAEMYEVPTKALNQAVKRNPGRFHVPAHCRRGRLLEVTICDFKLGRSAAIHPDCLYRAGCCHAVQLSEQTNKRNIRQGSGR